MSRFFSHLNTAKTIVAHYKGEMPLTVFLKDFFSKEKKYGSRDRKTISSLCYSYFRLGFALKEKTTHEKMLAGLFLSTTVPNELLQNEKPEWNGSITQPLSQKLRLAEIDVKAIFPFEGELSEGMDIETFSSSFFIQPDLFVRVRPGKTGVVKSKLIAAKTSFKEIIENCFAFANGTKLENILDINKEVVIQDLNSQRVGELLPVKDFNTPVKVWDCCAASGGKSIMTYDLVSDVQLTVSDVRLSIIQNLHNRFKEAGIKNYHSFVADLTNSASLSGSLKQSAFDLIICDAPCSGSGTWSRTPEELVFFKQEEIIRYSNLQKSIAKNAISYLKKGSYFLYITCSVLKKENEEVVEFIKATSGLELIKMELLKGYKIKADTMFAALFKSPQ
ncbi:methyltransferase domain-containing protein [Segetibacter sp.]|jgi:16S rRNA (cytosine967-C5)-methyltransferase|uniref:methyltransferase domain-containing protein n=1 Tax=Segetibacter sp. TaxID=2231182 RepID=UPI00262B364E|nr:methyltransferase domain-containing protein [Segetibacter sp.]MCW3080658.1 Fmu (Sun) domain protein [Segetibacter sp.]